MEKVQLIHKSCWSNWHSACKRMKRDPFLYPCTNLKCKWIKDLHIKPDTLKLLGENVGKNLEHIGTGENFLNRTPIGQALRSKINKCYLMRLQSFCNAKDIVKKTKWQPTEWEKIFTNSTSDRVLISIHNSQKLERTQMSFRR